MYALTEKKTICLMNNSFSVESKDLQDLVVFHTMTRFRSLFSRRMVGSPKENQLEALEGNKMRTRRERGEREATTCFGRATPLINGGGRPSLSHLFIALMQPPQL